MRCPRCKNHISAEDQLSFCNHCGAELRTVCPRCNADNPGSELSCRDCGLEFDREAVNDDGAGIRTGNLSEETHPPLVPRGVLMLIVLIGVAVYLWAPLIFTWRDEGRVKVCRTNMRKLAVAMALYAKDNDSHMPAADGWSAALRPFYKSTKFLACPARKAKFGYAMNENMSGLSMDLPAGADAIGFFEAPGDAPNLYGTDFEWLEPPAHPNGNHIVTLRGSVHLLSKKPDLAFWGLPSQPVATPEPTAKPEKPEKPGTEGGSVTLENPPAPGSTATPTPPQPAVPTATPEPAPAASSPPTAEGALPNPTPPPALTNPPPPAPIR